VQNFWIIGGGKFGLRAARVLRKADSSNQLKIVEKRRAVCRQLNRVGFETVCTDGIRYLERNLVDPNFPDWIIPAIPVHVAYEWLRAKLSAGKGTAENSGSRCVDSQIAQSDPG
jgi:predicted NAD/FAD-dependent oxidoreductase